MIGVHGSRLPELRSAPGRRVRTNILRRLGGEFLALLDRLLDGYDYIERGFGQLVVLALDEPLEALDGFLEVDEHAGRAGEHFGDVERLGEKALDLARPRHPDLVILRELVH